MAALPSDSATNAEPEQVTAPEDQPTETTSREVESAPSPDSDTGQESPSTSGEATVSGGVQRDQHAPGDDEPEAARDPRLADVARSLAANQGPIHTWQDGVEYLTVRNLEVVAQRPQQRRDPGVPSVSQLLLIRHLVTRTAPPTAPPLCHNYGSI